MSGIASPSAFGSAEPGREWTVAKVDGRALEHLPFVVHDNTAALTPVEERQTVPPLILAHAALAAACNLAVADQCRHKRGREAEPHRQNGRIDLDGPRKEADAGWFLWRTHLMVLHLLQHWAGIASAAGSPPARISAIPYGYLSAQRISQPFPAEWSIPALCRLRS
jgi:hypothetical protein